MIEHSKYNETDYLSFFRVIMIIFGILVIFSTLYDTKITLSQTTIKDYQVSTECTESIVANRAGDKQESDIEENQKNKISHQDIALSVFKEQSCSTLSESANQTKGTIHSVEDCQSGTVEI